MAASGSGHGSTQVAVNGQARIAFEDLTSSASLPGDVGGLPAGRYVHAGLVARLARLRFPEGRDGDIALVVAATRAVASPAYPFDEQAVREMAARDEVRRDDSSRLTARITSTVCPGSR
jgi:hypothetical protein